MKIGLVALMIALATDGSALAQTGSAFTYQGRATSNGVLIDGTISVQLSIWKERFSNIAADRIGSVQTINNVAVKDGVFTGQLGFSIQKSVCARYAGSDMNAAANMAFGEGCIRHMFPWNVERTAKGPCDGNRVYLWSDTGECTSPRKFRRVRRSLHV